MDAQSQFAALADAIRRAIFEALAERECSVGELAAQFPISRPAVSQHLRGLEGAALGTPRAEGARNVYRVDPRGLVALRACVDAMWDRALHDFKRVAEATHGNQRKRKEGP